MLSIRKDKTGDAESAKKLHYILLGVGKYCGLRPGEYFGGGHWAMTPLPLGRQDSKIALKSEQN